jgi:hypothetical protein
VTQRWRAVVSPHISFSYKGSNQPGLPPNLTETDLKLMMKVIRHRAKEIRPHHVAEAGNSMREEWSPEMKQLESLAGKIRTLLEHLRDRQEEFNNLEEYNA